MQRTLIFINKRLLISFFALCSNFATCGKVSYIFIALSLDQCNRNEQVSLNKRLTERDECEKDQKPISKVSELYRFLLQNVLYGIV